MSDYFSTAIEKGALLLDASNYEHATFKMGHHFRGVFAECSEGQLELGYDEPAGSYALRSKIAEWESGIGQTRIAPQDIAMFCGGVTAAIDAVFRIIKELSADNSGEMIIPVPCYPGILRAARANGVRATTIETDFTRGFQPTAEQISRALTNTTRGVFLTSPGNPVTTTIELEELIKIIALCKQHNLILVLDAIFEDAISSRPTDQLFGHSDYARLIKLKGPSKDRPHLHDLRIGWAVTKDEGLAERLRQISEVTGFSVSLIANEMLCKEFDLRHAHFLGGAASAPLKIYGSEVQEYFGIITAGKRLVMEMLAVHPAVSQFFCPDFGNLVAIKVEKDVTSKKSIFNDDDLFNFLLAKSSVAISPGSVFGFKSEELWFRVTISKRPEEFCLHLKRALDQLLAA